MREILETGLPQVGAGIECIPQLEEFTRLLLEKNQVMNLTAITDPGEVATLHLLDSLAVWQAGGLEGRSLLDVGTGAGFPGLPLRIAHPDLHVSLLDSLGKRVAFLQETCAALGLADVECIHGRAEEFARDHRGRFDVVVSRAVANLRILAELCLPLVKTGGRFLSMKAVDSREEIQGAEKALEKLGGTLEQVIDYTIPTTDIRHRLLVIRKKKETPRQYPRRFAQIKKQPL